MNNLAPEKFQPHSKHPAIYALRNILEAVGKLFWYGAGTYAKRVWKYLGKRTNASPGG